jgi:1-acyl-sn-glycerol-3-phosphate acyltransferase
MAGLRALDFSYDPDSFGTTALAAMRAAGLVATLTELVVRARGGERSAAAFAERARRTAQKILDGHGVDVAAAGTVPRGPAVVVANHLTYLDPLVVSSLLPCLSIAKGETRGWPLIGPGLEGLGVIFVRRGDASSGAVALRRAHRALRSGTAVLNFPEGTTSDGRDVGPFLRGAFGLARIAGVPIVPARIGYDSDFAPWFGGRTFVPHYAKLARVPRLRASVCFGDPIQVHPSDESLGVAARARDVIAGLRAG